MDQGDPEVRRGTRVTEARLDLLDWTLLVPQDLMDYHHLAVDGRKRTQTLSILDTSETVQQWRLSDE